MERCPCCKARLPKTSLCNRCGTDLSLSFAAEQAAKTLLAKAINLALAGQTLPSLDALQQSLLLDATPLGLRLLEFLIAKQYQQILELLAQKQIVMAKQQLHALKTRQPQNELLEQLQGFSDYLLMQQN
jgi:hypothetical protein